MAGEHIQTGIDLPNKAYILPDSIPMWPPVWWTWLVLAALLLAIGLVIAYRYRHYQKQAYRREALTVINDVTEELQDKDCILLCHEIIRRCLLSEGQTELAALPSNALLEKLDLSMPAKHQFSSLGDDFVNGPYRQNIKLAPEQRRTMIKATRYWIRKHHA